LLARGAPARPRFGAGRAHNGSLVPIRSGHTWAALRLTLGGDTIAALTGSREVSLEVGYLEHPRDIAHRLIKLRPELWYILNVRGIESPVLYEVQRALYYLPQGTWVNAGGGHRRSGPADHVHSWTLGPGLAASVDAASERWGISAASGPPPRERKSVHGFAR